MDPIATPTLDKLAEADVQRRAVLDFIEWLNEQGIHLAHWETLTYETLEGPYGAERPVTRKMPKSLGYIHERPDPLVMRWLGLDPKDVERERRALLDSIRQVPVVE